MSLLLASVLSLGWRYLHSGSQIVVMTIFTTVLWFSCHQLRNMTVYKELNVFDVIDIF